MKKLLMSLAGLAILFAGCGKAEKSAEKPVLTVAIVANSAPVAGATIKLADDKSLANALAATAPDQLFASLTDPEVATTDGAGHAKLPAARPQQYVVATATGQVWISPVSEARDWQLRLDEKSRASNRLTELAASRESFRTELAAAAEAKLKARQFAPARYLAGLAQAQSLIGTVNREEAADILQAGNAAFEHRDFSAARAAAERAEALVPNLPTTRELQRRILEEVGGELKTFKGHTAPVTCVAVSPDGVLAATGSEDRLIKIWDVKAGTELRTLAGHRAAVTGVAFSPDGRWLVSSGRDGTIRLWDVGTGTMVKATDGLGWQALCVAVSPNGRYVASGGDDNRAKIYELPGLQLVRQLSGHGWKVGCIAFSPDGTSLITGSEDDTVKFWNLSDGQNTQTLRVGFADVTGLSCAGRLLATAGKDKEIRLWNPSTGRELQVFHGSRGAVQLTANTRYVIAGGDDQAVRIWEINTGKEIATLTGHTGAITSLAIPATSKTLLTSSTDGTAKLWQLPRRLWPAE